MVTGHQPAGGAIIGSIVAAAYSHGIDASRLPSALRAAARPAIANADAVASRAGALGPQVTQVAHKSFTSAMTTGFAVAAVTALVGAIAVAFSLPGRLRARTMTEFEPTSDVVALPMVG